MSSAAAPAGVGAGACSRVTAAASVSRPPPSVCCRVRLILLCSPGSDGTAVARDRAAAMPRLLAVALPYLPIAGPAAEPQLERSTFSEPHMGTRFKVIVYAPDGAAASRAAKAAFARIASLDASMSDYRPTSELMR